MRSSIVVVRKANAEDRLPLYRMLDLYQHDLSDIWDQDLDAHGEYGYNLDRFWREQDCHPFVVTVDGSYAGFALVDTAVKVGDDGYWMEQFFILKKYRRRGIGQTLAQQVLEVAPFSRTVFCEFKVEFAETSRCHFDRRQHREVSLVRSLVG